MFNIDLIKEYLLILTNKLAQYYKKKPDLSHGTKTNVILIHGFNENWHFMKNIGERLYDKGFGVRFTEFGTHKSVEECAEEIFKSINELRQVILIGHSKGGIISRFLLLKHPELVSKVILVSTPNKGTIFGKLGFRNLSEMNSESELLKYLEEDSRFRDRITNFYPKFDNHVIPNSSLILDGARNIKIDINGHTRILDSKELIQEIENVLA